MSFTTALFSALIEYKVDLDIEAQFTDPFVVCLRHAHDKALEVENVIQYVKDRLTDAEYCMEKLRTPNVCGVLQTTTQQLEIANSALCTALGLCKEFARYNDKARYILTQYNLL